MQKPTQFKVTILPDGRVKMETDTVGAAVHTSAERAIAQLARLLGGQSETIRKREGHTHTHGHDHDHNSAGH